ncbi:MAG: cysteine hydrolase family protein [Candidatus Woesearchaeota archaeon]
MNNKLALLIIDLQNDFIIDNSILKVSGINENISKVNSFINIMRDKVSLVIFTRHIFDPKKNPIESKMFPSLKDEGLRDNTFGSEICSGIDVKKKDIIIKKNRYDAFFNTNLDDILEENNISTLIIIGTMTNVCCESTARTSMIKDYNVIFCSDLTFTNNKGLHNATLLNIKSHFGKVMNSEEILNV